MDAGNQIRHCAFCFREICGLLVKKCGGCKKRAYCSKECQTADWSLSGSGQRHKNWCRRYEYGEEDVDWEVLPVENKGLGVVAKRLLPAGYRIIVEPVYTDPNDHPGIKDLEPIGASLEAKFKLNSFRGNEVRDGGKSVLGLRTSRLNHSCRPNAGLSYDEVARVRILVAQQDIQLGEEICITYSAFGCLLDNSPKNDLLNLLRTHPDEEFVDIQRSLMVNWGITCPSDCYCKNPRSKKLFLEGKKFFKTMLSLASKDRTEEALKAGEELLKIDTELNFSWTQRADIYFKLFDIASGKKNEVTSRASRYLKSTCQFYEILHPFSEATRVCREAVNRTQ